jgi:pectinesterase
MRARINISWFAAVLSVLATVSWTPFGFAVGPDTGPSAQATKPIQIVLAGDSTVTDEAGWGVGFAQCLTDEAECINLARGGRSSKSFIAEGLWADCLNRKPDYLLIQFGHNDQPGHGLDRETDLPTYRVFMTQYIVEAKAAGIKPVLVTSLSRRHWGRDGTIHSTLLPYVDVVKAIAIEEQVPLIDLHARSVALYEGLGAEGCKALSPLKDDTIDNTHLNRHGSELVGPIVAEELQKVVPGLAGVIKPRQD